MSQTYPETATEKHGVFKSSDGWRYRHYGPPHMEGQSAGPYPTRVEAMKALLHQVGFAVEDDQPVGLAQTGQQWMPIETAPQDGTPVIVWDDPVRGEAYFETGDKAWWWSNTGPGDYVGDAIYPTLWQPLPALPDTSTDRCANCTPDNCAYIKGGYGRCGSADFSHEGNSK